MDADAREGLRRGERRARGLNFERETRARAAGASFPRATMTKARDAKETKGDDGRSPSEAHTLFYSPYYDVPSDLGFPPAPRSTAGTAHSAAPSSTRGFSLKKMYHSAISAFKPFKRSRSPERAGNGTETGKTLRRPKARRAFNANAKNATTSSWFWVFDSPKSDPAAPDPAANDENESGAVVNDMSIEEGAHVLGEINRDLSANARETTTRSTTAPKNVLKVRKTILKKPLAPAASKYHRRTDPLKNGQVRKCSKCAIEGDNSIHWRRSYDSKSPFFGADLCDRCGKAESRALAKRNSSTAKVVVANRRRANTRAMPRR